VGKSTPIHAPLAAEAKPDKAAKSQRKKERKRGAAI